MTDWKQADWERAWGLLVGLVEWQRGRPINQQDRGQIQRYLIRQGMPDPALEQETTWTSITAPSAEIGATPRKNRTTRSSA